MIGGACAAGAGDAASDVDDNNDDDSDDDNDFCCLQTQVVANFSVTSSFSFLLNLMYYCEKLEEVNSIVHN